MTEELVQTKTWEDFLPKGERIELHYVDYRDSLDEHEDLLEECVRANSLMPLSEECYDWYIDDTYSLDQYMDNVESEMEEEGLSEEFNENEDNIREWFWENNQSDIVKDLLRNTSDVTACYDLGEEIENYWDEGFMYCCHKDGIEDETEAKLMGILNIKPNTKAHKLIKEIVAESSYGGNARIYFPMPLKELISENEDKAYWGKDDKDDFKAIHFKGTFAVAIYNSYQGAGWFEGVELDVWLPFDRDNLHLSSAGRYSIEECFGMSSDWASDFDQPEFRYKMPEEFADKKIEKSSTCQILDREAEYERVFKAGGCTAGDMCYRRHRNVEYINEVPCGSRCKDCGTFWID